jgi:hypothetical protein
MAAAARGLLAFWAGGAVTGIVPTAVRSMLAPWAGGAVTGVAPVVNAAVRSLLAFWAGGSVTGIGQTTEGAIGGARSGERFDYEAFRKKKIKRLRIERERLEGELAKQEKASSEWAAYQDELARTLSELDSLVAGVATSFAGIDTEAISRQAAAAIAKAQTDAEIEVLRLIAQDADSAALLRAENRRRAIILAILLMFV